MLTVRDIAGRKYTKDDFVFFWGHADRGNAAIGRQCLSQWHVAPMVIDGQYYNCMEQYLMAEKARVFGDAETEAKIMSEYSQMAVKKLGRQVAGYDDSVWSAKRQDVSVRGNIHKFACNRRLKEFLLSTGDKILAEASPKDKIWGIGLDESHPDAVIPARWPGENLLGFALMEVRSRLRAIQQKLDAIIALKEDTDPWPPKDFIEFCDGHTFTEMLQWDSETDIFEDIKKAIVGLDARNVDRIMIDMQYGRGFVMLPFMFFEQMHVVLDPVALQYGFDYIFSLSPDKTMTGRKVHLTLFA